MCEKGLEKFLENLVAYKTIINKCWPNPPKTMFAHAFSKTKKYPLAGLEYIFDEQDNEKLVGGCIVFKLGESIFGISAVAIDPDYQGGGYGTKLMKKIHNKYKGIFLLKVRKDRGSLYSKLGYHLIGESEKEHYMVYMNNPKIIDF